MEEDYIRHLVKLGENRIDPRNIVACLSDHGATRIITTSGIVTYGRSLSQVKKKLWRLNMVEVGRHGIINPDHLLRVHSKDGVMTLHLTGDVKVHVSGSAQCHFQ
jgi:hypothetical protein